jgi:cytochrome c553
VNRRPPARRPGRRIAAVLVAFAAASTGPSAAADAATAADFEPRVRPCYSCHGEQGRATPDGYYPRIAGKPAGYLFEQLLHFRDGRRVNDMMSYLVDRQREDTLRRMAEHFAALDLPHAPPAPVSADAATRERGARLVREGDTSRDLPACTACHGDAMTGIEPAVPGLLGLPQDYVAAQLGAWREGARRAREPDCMALIARRLEPADIAAISAWLAAQAVPGKGRAQAGPVRTPPMRCGVLEVAR